MRGGLQKHLDIIDNMFIVGVPKGLKRAFRDAKNAHIREKYRQRATKSEQWSGSRGRGFVPSWWSAGCL